MKPVRIVISVGLSLIIGCLLVLITTSASASVRMRYVAAPSATTTFYAIADSYINSGSPAQNYGNASILGLGTKTVSATERALIRFDLSSLPTDAVVDSASFRAYLTQTTSTPTLVDVGVYQILGSWGESGVVWNTQPPVVSIGKVNGVSTTLKYYDWDIINLAQGWVANPASNFGLELRSETEGSYGWRGFASRETTLAYRPEVVIGYHLPTPTHTPTPTPTNTPTPTPSPTDSTPPKILSGPTVLGITSNSATVSWTTDEASDSTVRVGRKAGLFEGEETNNALTQAHAIVLTELQPSATYHYVIRSADATGNAVTSRDAYFTTGPATGSAPPSISEVTLTRMPGKAIYYNIAARVPADADVERVEFYMDGKPIGTAYTPKFGAIPGLYEFPLIPAALDITREEFFTDHTIEAIAIGAGGPPGRFPVPFNPPYECDDLSVDIVRPYEDEILYTDGNQLPPGTNLHIDVRAYQIPSDCPVHPSPNDPQCKWMEEIDHVEFRVNGHLECTLYDDDPNQAFRYTCPWNTSNLDLGDYQIRVDAIASEECKQTVSSYVTVARGEPRLEVTREVTRHGNYFEVALTVENRGTASIVIDQVEDNLVGFQPIMKTSNLPQYQVTANCRYFVTTCDVAIDVSGDVGGWAETLGPGEHLNITYLIVPILRPETEDVGYAIGSEPVIVHVLADPSEQSFDRPCVAVADGSLLAEAVYSATAESDYLLVTRPIRLYGLYNDDDTDALLSAIAKLAQFKNGILGYLNSDIYSDEEAVRDTILEWGQNMRGSDGVAGNYLSNGYLLFVGETEVVPSFNISSNTIAEATADWPGGGVDPVRGVDNQYANVKGGPKPELAIGRLIGNDAAKLRTPIETSLLNAFDCSNALAISGLGHDQTQTDGFNDNADQLGGALRSIFPDANVIVDYRSNYNTRADALAAFRLLARERDAIFYTDHGAATAWVTVTYASDFPLDFQGSHPFVAALACSTGHYQRNNQDKPSRSIAEAFLDSQAGAYLGSTELSEISTNDEAGPLFVKKWYNDGNLTTLGIALKNTKRSLWGPDFWPLDWFGDPWVFARLWVLEYNLYGDPKYGVCAAAPNMTLTSMAQPAPVSLSSLNIIVPDYQVTSAHGVDTARIPGGLMLLDPGFPMVPTYIVTQDYPKGYRVQNVTLTARWGITTATGLSLPLVSGEPAYDDGSDAMQLEQAAQGWYPKTDFTWEIEENPDGTTALIIRMYPFYYNASTTDVQFYKNYSFDIQYITSTIEIAALTTDKNTYTQGEVVRAGFWVTNTSMPRDVVVSAVVRSESSGEVVDGFPLETLRDVGSLAAYSHEWNSTNFAPGYYTVEAELKDEAGNVLARADKSFRVGLAVGEITAFAVSPTSFKIGDQVSISLTFANTGTVPLTGTTVVQIQSEAGGLIKEFSHDYADLAPGSRVSFADVWNTSGTARGDYRVIAYVLYESTATEPSIAMVGTGRSLYLPLILNRFSKP
jgi:hypothetical protein